MKHYDIAARSDYIRAKRKLDEAMTEMSEIMGVANQNDPRAIILAAESDKLMGKAYRAMHEHDIYVNGEEY